jgi:type IV pilus assembly protein PilE
MQHPTQPSGFTLIELLIVIMLISILVTLGYPNYKQYLEQARRTDGQAALLDLANRLEEYYAEHNTYSTATLGTGNSETDLLSVDTSPTGWYNLSIITQDDTTFLIQATPKNAQENDTLCQSLTLDSVGEKGITSGPEGEPSGKIEECWG